MDKIVIIHTKSLLKLTLGCAHSSDASSLCGNESFPPLGCPVEVCSPAAEAFHSSNSWCTRGKEPGNGESELGVADKAGSRDRRADAKEGNVVQRAVKIPQNCFERKFVLDMVLEFRTKFSFAMNNFFLERIS